MALIEVTMTTTLDLSKYMDEGHALRRLQANLDHLERMSGSMSERFASPSGHPMVITITDHKEVTSCTS